VARAGATGGGRTYRGHRPVRWYGALVLIVLLGTALIAYSRYERQHPSAGAQPTIGAHWFQALAFDICGTIQPNLPANPNEASAAPGLHTAGDGVIEVSPTKSSDAGANATLGKFVSEYPKLALSPTSVRLPGRSTHRNGDSCPSGTPDAGKKGQLRVKVWPSFTPPGSNNPFFPSDPTTQKLADGQLITIAFVPSTASIPKPPAAVVSAMLQDRATAAQSSSSTTLPTSTPSTTAPSSSSTTPSPSTTTAGSSSTTKP
jgi:hypothetical protein